MESSSHSPEVSPFWSISFDFKFPFRWKLYFTCFSPQAQICPKVPRNLSLFDKCSNASTPISLQPVLYTIDITHRGLWRDFFFILIHWCSDSFKRLIWTKTFSRQWRYFWFFLTAIRVLPLWFNESLSLHSAWYHTKIWKFEDYFYSHITKNGNHVKGLSVKLT